MDTVISLKAIKLQDHTIKLAYFGDTAWVALKSLTTLLNLNYDNQVRMITGATSLSAMGSSTITAHGKMLAEPGGVKDIWIPMGDVSLWATKVQMEDLTRIEQQNLCATLLPTLMSKAF